MGRGTREQGSLYRGSRFTIERIKVHYREYQGSLYGVQKIHYRQRSGSRVSVGLEGFLRVAGMEILRSVKNGPVLILASLHKFG